MFDLRDPYDAAALYDMWFNCECCPKTFNFEPGGSINLNYYHQIGQAAKKAGWAVEVRGSKASDREYVTYCPQCALKERRKQSSARDRGLEMQVALVADLLNGSEVA